MNAQTIAGAYKSTQSLWDFLAALPTSFEAQLLYALLLSGLAGMFANYLVRWARQEIAGSLWAYLVVQNPRGTILSFCTYLSAALLAIWAGVFVVADNVFVGWGAVLWLGATNGFAIDAIANKGQRPVWTQAERTEKGTP